ncbi:MAG: RHS repeat-associated core domain-containing protein, partial [Defluviitaleaceae bacterium]|nr:RHS repeat-associated core domain-containing protein [Defluviitaleaceae bacterium]
IHYLQDHLGSPIRLLSNDGNSINALAYDEFGVQEVFPMQAMQTQHSLKGQQPQQQLTKLFSNPFGYTGYQLDDITEMHYAQARYYTPTTGRFTAEDPIQDRLNWYGYCSANPMTSVDPTGLSGGGLNDMLNTIDDGTNVAPWHNPAPRQTTPRTPTPTPSPRPSEPEPARQGGGECGARNLAPVDFIHCCVNGLVFVCFQTGDVLSTLQPIAPVTGIVFCDTLTSAQRLELERTLVYLNQSETFRNLWDTLQYGGELLTIAFTDGFMTRYMPYSRRIYWDPAHGLVLGNGIYVQSPALGLAHEMGHAAQHLEEHYYFTTWYANHTSDALRLRAENNNIARFETPIANELGEYARRSYRDFIGDFGMSTSTDWGILHTRPAWHYLSPLVWGQQRVTFESQNTWMPEPECDVK